MLAACIRSPGGDGAPVMTTPAAHTDGGPAANGSGKITRDAVLAAALEIIDRQAPTRCPCGAWPAPSAGTR